MCKLIVLVGLPRSGKSTWAIGNEDPIVNRDSIRLALHGEAYLQPAENMITVLEDNMVKSLFLAGHDRVVVDATHTHDKARSRWEKMAKKEGWTIQYVAFTTSKDECLNRAIDGGRTDLVPVIERMAEQITFPEGCNDSI
jgi:predicted kinase